jgi:hypothetical protein
MKKSILIASLLCLLFSSARADEIDLLDKTLNLLINKHCNKIENNVVPEARSYLEDLKLLCEAKYYVEIMKRSRPPATPTLPQTQKVIPMYKEPPALSREPMPPTSAEEEQIRARKHKKWLEEGKRLWESNKK